MKSKINKIIKIKTTIKKTNKLANKQNKQTNKYKINKYKIF